MLGAAIPPILWAGRKTGGYPPGRDGNPATEAKENPASKGGSGIAYSHVLPDMGNAAAGAMDTRPYSVHHNN